MASNRLKVIVRTYGGQAARVAVLIAASVIDPSGAVVTAIKAAIAALSTGAVTRSAIAKTAVASVTSGTGSYQDDQDKVDMTFIDANGQYETYRIPAPLDSIFSDGEHVDLANGAVIAYAGWMTSNAKSITGAALSALVKGKRIRLKSGRRV